MKNPKAFFDRARSMHGGKLTQQQVDGLTRLYSTYERYNWPIAYAAYGLATSKRECGGLYTPVREGFKKTDAEAREYVKKHYPTKYGKPTIYGGQYAYGRGDVQLTWAPPNKDNIDNYGKADKKLAALGLIKAGELTKNFDLALRPDLSAVIMVSGMQEGWFTGKKLSDYLDKQPPDFRNARRVINGTDHADEIASDALLFMYALQDGGYDQFPAQPEPPPAPRPPDLPAPPEPPAPVVTEKLTLAQRIARLFGRG